MCRVKSVLGSIHTDEVIKLYAKLGVSSDILDILKFGLKPTYTPDANFKKHSVSQNNKSVTDHLEECREEVRAWEQQGFIQRVDPATVDCINPLSYAVRYSHAKQKYVGRLCLDTSRTCDLHVVPKIKMPDLSYLSSHIKSSSFIFVADLMKCFMHVTLHPSVRKNYGFQLDMGNGEVITYVFVIMIWGIAISPYIIYLLTRPIVDYLHRQGIFASPYIGMLNILLDPHFSTWCR